MKWITKKILPEYFKDVVSGRKTFELRKDEDDIQPGDILNLQEWSPDDGYSGDQKDFTVTYVLRNCPQYGLMDGYCIIGIKDKIGFSKSGCSMRNCNCYYGYPLLHQCRHCIHNTEVKHK